MNSNARFDRSGVGIVEVLAVVAIVGMLTALLLPAVNTAREAARKTQCVSNVRQLSIACLQHEASHSHYPTGGWAYTWIGEPERGYGKNQPGGWIFNILPFIEYDRLRTESVGLRGEGKLLTNARLNQTVIEVLRCGSQSGRALSSYGAALPPRNAAMVELVAKAHYAINSGDVVSTPDMGPDSLTQVDRGRYSWPKGPRSTGLSFQRSTVRLASATDGTSKTYLLGEKYIPLIDTVPAENDGHDQSMYSGYDFDTCRWTRLPPAARSSIEGFGGAHIGGVNMALSDGSVHTLSWGIDAEVHRARGNRSDSASPSVFD